MQRWRLTITIAAICIFLSVGTVIALPYSESYPTADEPTNKIIPEKADMASGGEERPRANSVPEGAIVILDEEKAAENVIRDPLALRGAARYTNEDLRAIARKSVADELTMAEIGAIREGMTKAQIEKVREHIRFYRGMNPATYREHRDLEPQE